MRKTLIVLLCVVLAPSAAYAQASAQASITGVVRDTSGAVLPGVTVEASSPALIQKVRSAVTDSNGQYRIVDLPAGNYSVTFLLAGFTTTRREGVELSGAFTAPVNVELRVGTLEETITVTGESPIVDVQSSRRQQVLDRDTVTAIPSARAYHSLAVLVPGITASTNDVGGLGGPVTVTFAIHGGRANEGRLQVDGMGVGSTLNGGGVSYYSADIGNAQEIAFTTSGGLGEAEVGGPVMSIVPRTGGNTVRGSFYANGAAEGHAERQLHAGAARRRPPAAEQHDEDVGPQRRVRRSGQEGSPVVLPHVALPGQPEVRHQHVLQQERRRPDEMDLRAGREARDQRRHLEEHRLRLTWQPTRKNNFNIFWDEQTARLDHLGGGTPTTSPEAAGTTDSAPLRARQITWRSPMTSRLLLEGGYGQNGGRWGGRERGQTYVGGQFIDGNATRTLIRVLEQQGDIPNLTYRSMNWNSHLASSNRWRASASYVTGAHSMKAGYEGTFLINNQKSFTNDHRSELSVQQRRAEPAHDVWPAVRNQDAHRRRIAFYVQDQSTFGRLTLQGALRYDYAYSRFLDQQVGPERFIPVPIVLPAQDGVKGFHDLSPRARRRLRPVRRRQDVAAR